MKNKLPVEFKEKWVAALRSGEYKQVTEVMYDESECGYCCLGVGAALCGISDDDMKNVGEPYDLEVDYENMPIAPVFNSGHICSILIKMNDHEGKSFDTIADYIEQHL